jgi:hypothetical protein
VTAGSGRFDRAFEKGREGELLVFGKVERHNAVDIGFDPALTNRPRKPPDNAGIFNGRSAILWLTMNT